MNFQQKPNIFRLFTLLGLTALALVASGLSRCQAQVTQDSTKIIVFIQEHLSFCPGIVQIVKPDSIQGGQPPYTLFWTLPSENTIIADSLLWESADSAHIQIRVTDAEGRTAIANTFLEPYPSIDASFSVSNNSGCIPFDVLFRSDYMAFQHIESMIWKFNENNTDTSMSSVMHTYNQAGEYWPSLTVLDKNGCRWTDTLNMSVRAFPTPKAQFSLLENQIYLPETSISLTNESQGAGQFLWTFDQWGQSTEAQPDFSFPLGMENDYLVSLYVYNAFGCMDEAHHQVSIVQAIELYIPNAFTPDGDGINDDWLFQGLGVDSYYVTTEIYDNWGTVVYSSYSADAAWSGENSLTGEKVHPGLYNYRIVARDTEHGVGHLFEGHISVLR
jgi:gliding motility-associated-like protein